MRKIFTRKVLQTKVISQTYPSLKDIPCRSIPQTYPSQGRTESPMHEEKTFEETFA
jgi:hypothetical protein